MQHTFTIIQTLKFTVEAEKIERFTSLLQSGMDLAAAAGTPIGRFLEELPGFDLDYLNERVQTIFFDGSAIDDLDRPLCQPSHSLALSAAMPGLAGAIFRKNSFVGALRTRKEQSEREGSTASETTVRLKLFNVIAREKGEGLLSRGGTFPTAAVIDFFHERPSLLDAIRSCELDGRPCPAEDLPGRLQTDGACRLTLTRDEGGPR